MNTGYLDKIIATKRMRVAEAKQRRAVGDLERMAAENSGSRRDLAAALARSDRINVIAEFKRASPSLGVIDEQGDPVEAAREYAANGAAAISILTESDFFKGSLDDMRMVRETVGLPILRKDFIVDEYQILESAAYGADAILLIAAAVEPECLERLHSAANRLGLAALVEVHGLSELSIAIGAGANIIGVNNRDLRTFDVSLDTSRTLIKHIPKGLTPVSESGISSRDELLELRSLGYSAFLVGEALMRSEDRGTTLRRLVEYD